MLFMMTDNCAGDGGWSCHDDKALRVGGEVKEALGKRRSTKQCERRSKPG